MAFSGFEFFFFFILVPPLTVFEGGIEGVSVSGSPVVLWNLLIPIKTSGGSCLAVMCSCSNTWGAERIGKRGSWFTRGHENGYARAHHRGLQWWAALQLLAANGRNNLIAGEVLHPEHINTSFSLYEEVCEHRESIIITPDGFTSSFPGSDTVRQKKWGVLALLLEKNVSDAGYDLLSLQLFCWQIYIKSFLFIKYSVKYNENK